LPRPESDGCTVPRLLRLWVPLEPPEQRACCEAHDAAYEAGGTRRERAIADARLLVALLEAGMDVDLAERYHSAVRMFGKTHWAGGRYTDEPPEPEGDPMELAGRVWRDEAG
jgi:hypothetical protein